MKNKYYFTYGSEGHPFKGGWSIVVAESMQDAIALFDLVHPRKSDFVNCASIYSETGFMETQMFKSGENHGSGCHEIIDLLIQRS